MLCEDCIPQESLHLSRGQSTSYSQKTSFVIASCYQRTIFKKLEPSRKFILHFCIISEVCLEQVHIECIGSRTRRCKMPREKVSNELRKRQHCRKKKKANNTAREKERGNVCAGTSRPTQTSKGRACSLWFLYPVPIQMHRMWKTLHFRPKNCYSCEHNSESLKYQKYRTARSSDCCHLGLFRKLVSSAPF